MTTLVSVVSPFYNEEAILESSISAMIRQLSTLEAEWELIVVNDGSTDRSLAIAQAIEPSEPRLRVVTYPNNRGRGFAIRTGVAHARGDLVVTTEIDGSWGENIVHRIVTEFQKRPDADVVIASPHLPGGGYRNVPLRRVALSTLGNYIIRTGLTYEVTMNTGMTRGYRREKFLSLPLDEVGKELHLEIVNKSLAFGYRIYEIPAVLEWRHHNFQTNPSSTRKSSSKIKQLIRTHLLFTILAAPFRYIYAASGMLAVMAVGFLAAAVLNLFNDAPSIYLLLVSLLLAIFAFLFFSISVLAQQGRMLQRDLWRVRSALIRRDDSSSTQA